MQSIDYDAMTYKQFCVRHNVSLSYFYELLKAGNGPRVIRVGSKRLVSQDAAREWRKRFETTAA